MRVLKVVAVVVLAFVAWGLGAARRQERKEAIRAAVVRAVSPEPTVWTAEDKLRLADGLPVERLDFLVFEEDRLDMRNCFAGKFMAALPGGPAEMALMSRDGRLERISHDAGFACAQEYSERVAAEPAWSPRFAPVFVMGCVRDGGESVRSACACLAEKAPRFYASPPDFLKVMNKARDARSATEHRKWMRLITACADTAP